MSNKEVINRITALCSSHKLSIYQLSKAADIPISTLYSMIKNESYPSIPTLIQICSCFDISLCDFFAPKLSLTNKKVHLSKNHFSSQELNHLYDIVASLDASKHQYLVQYIEGLCDK